jgi:hypothetical protein
VTDVPIPLGTEYWYGSLVGSGGAGRLDRQRRCNGAYEVRRSEMNRTLREDPYSGGDTVGEGGDIEENLSNQPENDPDD